MRYLLKSLWRAFMSAVAFMEEALQGDYQAPVVEPELEKPLSPKSSSMPIQTKADHLYALSKSLIGQHLTLNEAVPWMVGCMEAVSKLLVEFDVTGIPPKGIEGTLAGLTFLEKSPQFQEIYTYTPGAVVVAATGTGNGKIRGHIGICGHNSVMSNNSETGKWDTQWDISRFTAYYMGYGGMKIRFFLPV